jgi:arylsulfatase
MLRRLLIVLTALATWISCSTGATETPPDPRPNILLIVADDLGYADLGVFGSDIRTPNIDALARQGLRFSQFHTAPMCAPTRAMLLSGNNNHVAGMGEQQPSLPMKGVMPGYEGHLSDRVAPLPRVLQQAGYHTYMAGKWHLGTEAENSPKQAGFERSFGVVDGAASHFDGRGFENRPNIYRQDGELTEWPEGAYATELYTDRLIGYIEANRGDGRPFFAFAAYTSPHWPLQVPEDELDRYAGAYDAGYDALRETNFANLKDAGIVSPHASLPPRNEEITPWADLSEEQKRVEAREMELYAAMVENLDGHIGRLVAYLKVQDIYDSTLIVFMSDNGAAGEDFYNSGPFVDYIRERYDNSYENMGRPDSFVSYDDPWAEAGSAPFRMIKTYLTQGGIVAPMIMFGPGVAARSEIRRDYVTLMDIAPTFIEMAGAKYPDDGSVEPMRGTSLLPYLRGDAKSVHPQDEVTVLFHRNQALVRQGKWKLTAIETPFDERHFGLYDLEADPGETTDLSEAHPEKRAELIEIWRAERMALGIVLPQDL